MEETKKVRINDAAKAKMKSLAKEELNFKIHMITSC